MEIDRKSKMKKNNQKLKKQKTKDLTTKASTDTISRGVGGAMMGNVEMAGRDQARQ